MAEEIIPEDALKEVVAEAEEKPSAAPAPSVAASDEAEVEVPEEFRGLIDSI